MTDPADDIMRATYCALCKHGYADLTMRDIAEEADRSKASLHYHYERKQQLMLAFLEYLYERFTDRLGEYDGATDSPDERLRAFLEDLLHPPHDGDTAREFRTALLEIKAQAPYDEAFRDRLATFDEFVYGVVRDLVSAGIDEGVYREETDPDEVAQFVVTIIDGAQARHVVAGEDIACVQTAIESYLDAHRVPDAEVAS